MSQFKELVGIVGGIGPAATALMLKLVVEER
jgi:aspartate/glutamate racemase